MKRLFKCFRYRKHRLAALYLLWGSDEAVLRELGVIQLIRLSGKAKQVFRLWELFVRSQGNKTLGELAKKR